MANRQPKRLSSGHLYLRLSGDAYAQWPFGEQPEDPRDHWEERTLRERDE